MTAFATRPRGVTLLEMMLSVLLFALVIGPVFFAFRGSTRSSMEGMRRVDLVLEARRVLQQVHDDLRTACYPLTVQAKQLNLDDFLVANLSGSGVEGTYQITRFPLATTVAKAVSAHRASGNAPRLLNRVTYSIEKGEGGRSEYQLVRTEQMHPDLGGGTRKRVLTRRLNFFRISVVDGSSTFGGPQKLLQATIQLVARLDGKPMVVTGSPDTAAMAQAKVMIVDYFDVVCPEYYSALAGRSFNNRAYYTLPVAPP